MLLNQTEYHHPFLEQREIGKVGVLIISTDRGLCGGLNGNLFRQALKQFEEWEKEGKALQLSIVGNKGVNFFSRIGANIIGQVTQLGDAPNVEQLVGTIKLMVDEYLEGNLDRLYIVYNQFVNRMTQSPVFEQLLPLIPDDSDDLDYHWDYIYEPEAAEVLDRLFSRYIESLVYQGVVENIACEQAARMVAMKAASDNAGKLIDELQLVYNKARQAAITQELSEIVGGAAAV